VRQQNLDVLGDTADLNELLFGSKRNSLSARAPGSTRSPAWTLLLLRQRHCRGRGVCGPFHRVEPISGRSRPQLRAGRRRCNGYKRDRLPACEHLAKCVERNSGFGDQIASALAERGMIADLGASNRVAQCTGRPRPRAVDVDSSRLNDPLGSVDGGDRSRSCAHSQRAGSYCSVRPSDIRPELTERLGPMPGSSTTGAVPSAVWASPSSGSPIPRALG
jgi:hypothetical protein